MNAANKIQESYKQSLEGRKIWLGINEKYHITDADAVLIMPSKDLQLNKTVIKLIMQQKLWENTVVVSDQEEIFNKITGTQNNLYCEKLDKGAIDKLLKYYCMVKFCNNVFVVSLNEPFGNDFLVRAGKVSLEEYVLISILKRGNSIADGG